MSRLLRASAATAIAAAILAPSVASATCSVSWEGQRFACPGGGTCYIQYPVVVCGPPPQ